MTNTPKHTPGTWDIKPSCIAGRDWEKYVITATVKDSARYSPTYESYYTPTRAVTIARIQATGRSKSETLANAHLIAAAPELLEALKMLTDGYILADFDAKDPRYKALQAIAKAEGYLN